MEMMLWKIPFPQSTEPDEELLPPVEDEDNSEEEETDDKKLNLENIEEEDDDEQGMFPDTNIDLQFIKGGKYVALR